MDLVPDETQWTSSDPWETGKLDYVMFQERQFESTGDSLCPVND